MATTDLASPPTTTAGYALGQARGRAYADLCRFRVSRVPCLIVLAAGPGAERRSVAVAGCLLVLASTSMAGACNDLADRESDRANGRTDRPLVSGVLTPRAVTGVVIAGAIAVALAQAGLPQPDGLVVTAMAMVVALASSTEPIALQRRGVLGLLALGFGYFTLPMALVAGVGSLAAVWPLALLGAAVVAHKDVRDEHGDRLAGKRTLVVRHGVRSMSRRAALLGGMGLAGLVATLGVGAWTAPAVLAEGALVLMAVQGHTLRRWTWARLAVVTAATMLALHVGASTITGT